MHLHDVLEALDGAPASKYTKQVAAGIAFLRDRAPQLLADIQSEFYALDLSHGARCAIGRADANYFTQAAKLSGLPASTDAAGEKRLLQWGVKYGFSVPYAKRGDGSEWSALTEEWILQVRNPPAFRYTL